MSEERAKKKRYVRPVIEINRIMKSEMFIMGSVIGDHNPADDDELLDSKYFDFFEDDYEWPHATDVWDD